MQEYIKGDRVVVTEGDCSDYYIIGVYEALKPFCYEHEVAKMGFGFKDGSKYRTYKTGDSVFGEDIVKMLVDGGLLAQIAHKKLHIGEYGDISVLLSDIEQVVSSTYV